MSAFLTVLVQICLFFFFIICILTVTLIGMFVFQVGFRELFGVDPFIRLREYLIVKFAPRAANKNFFGDDGCFYISIPNYMLEKARSMKNIETNKFKQTDSEGNEI